MIKTVPVNFMQGTQSFAPREKRTIRGALNFMGEIERLVIPASIGRSFWVEEIVVGRIAFPINKSAEAFAEYNTAIPLGTALKGSWFSITLRNETDQTQAFAGSCLFMRGFDSRPDMKLPPEVEALLRKGNRN